MISVDRLSKSFGKHAALQHVSLDVARGEIYGLLGSNGSGKSTLIRILTGVLRPSSGNFALHGTTGYVAQRFGLYEDLLVMTLLLLLLAAATLALLVMCM